VAIELGGLDIEFKGRDVVKGQVIRDFMAEIPEGMNRGNNERMGEEEASLEDTQLLYVDGASCQEWSGIGLLLLSPDGKDTTHAVKLNFKASKDECEYEALIAGLRLAVKMKAQAVQAHMDEAKDGTMAQYLHVCQGVMKIFRACEVVHVSRSQNKKVDALSKLASCFTDPTTKVSIEELEPAVTNWMTPLIEYLSQGKMPEDKMRARKIQIKALHYQL
jgi:hypothetical protein